MHLESFKQNHSITDWMAGMIGCAAAEPTYK